MAPPPMIRALLNRVSEKPRRGESPLRSICRFDIESAVTGLRPRPSTFPHDAARQRATVDTQSFWPKNHVTCANRSKITFDWRGGAGFLLHRTQCRPYEFSEYVIDILWRQRHSLIQPPIQDQDKSGRHVRRDKIIGNLK